MAENTQAVDLVQELLAATFGPNTAAEVAKDEGVAFQPSPSGSSTDGADGSSTSLPPKSSTDGADGSSTSLPPKSSTDGADGSSTSLPPWWRFNLDGTPRKRCQAPEVLKGVPHGETRQRETDLLILKALHVGAESLVEITAQTGCVKETCVRSLERLVGLGRVVRSKTAPSGKRGRPAFVYRPTTEAEVPTGG